MKKLLIIAVAVILASLVFLAASRLFLRGTGTIATDTEGVMLILRDPWGRTVNVGPGTEATAARAEYYRPVQLYRTLQSTESEGAGVAETWQISGESPWGRLVAVEVRKDQTTTLAFSSPLKIEVDASVQRPYTSFALQIVGQHGEHYSPRIARNGKSVGKPKFTIFDQNGEKLHAGSFEYG